MKLRLQEAKHQEEKLMMQQRHDADVEKVSYLRVWKLFLDLNVAHCHPTYSSYCAINLKVRSCTSQFLLYFLLVCLFLLKWHLVTDKG